MTRRQRWIVAVLTVAIAATRIYALSRSLWDWDEALFSVGVRSYDVVQHHPHPPGFPLFIATAKLFTLIGFREFRALQLVAIAASCLIVPATIFLGRELRASFRVSMNRTRHSIDASDKAIPCVSSCEYGVMKL